MIDAYIALGSNLQKPLAQLQQATRAIASLPTSRVQRVSSVYRSTAVGPGHQPDYLNAVLHLQTRLPPLELLDALQAIETRQGRVRWQRWAARTLDLDMLLYGTTSLEEPRLRIPHPRMAERNFVLHPLLEISTANLMLPGGAELGTLVAACPPGPLQKTRYALISSDEPGLPGANASSCCD